MSSGDGGSHPLEPGLVALRDSLVADIGLARDRESHIRATARAAAAAELVDRLRSAQIRPDPLTPQAAVS